MEGIHPVAQLDPPGGHFVSSIRNRRATRRRKKNNNNNNKTTTTVWSNGVCRCVWPAKLVTGIFATKPWIIGNDRSLPRSFVCVLFSYFRCRRLFLFSANPPSLVLKKPIWNVFLHFHFNKSKPWTKLITEFYLVLPSFTDLYRVLPSFTEFYRVSSEKPRKWQTKWNQTNLVTEFHRDLFNFTKFYLVLPSFFPCFLSFPFISQSSGITEFYRVSFSKTKTATTTKWSRMKLITEFYLVLPSFTLFYRLLPSFT